MENNDSDIKELIKAMKNDYSGMKNDIYFIQTKVDNINYKLNQVLENTIAMNKEINNRALIINQIQSSFEFSEC